MLQVCDKELSKLQSHVLLSSPAVISRACRWIVVRAILAEDGMKSVLHRSPQAIESFKEGIDLHKVQNLNFTHSWCRIQGE